MTIPTIPQTIDETREAFASGRTVPLKWRREQLRAMGTMLSESAERIEQAVVEDLGKNSAEAHLTEVRAVSMEVSLLLRNLKSWTKTRRVRSSALMGTSRASVQRQPLGTVLIIGPWNYPLHLMLMPLAGAIAAGNSVVLKPSEMAPACSALLAELVPQYLDRDAIQVVEGGVDETTELLEHAWDHIFYTGNGAVGSIVLKAAAEHLTPVTLELGGKSPLWIDSSVSIKKAARSIAWGKFTNCGQTCVAPDYVLATADVGAELADEVSKAIEEFYGTDPRQSKDYGRIINERHAERLAGLLDDGDSTSGQVVTGGVADVAAKYVAPTVLLDVAPDAAVMQDEIFGPILPIVIVDGPDAAIDFINARPKPLALYAYTRQRKTRKAFEARTSSGGLTFNTSVVQLSVAKLPFGGVGASGMGAYHGEASVETFSHDRSILRKTRGLDFTPVVRPPYGRRKTQAITGRKVVGGRKTH
ncbi:aldehyde dehydrogenase family protein [Demequina sediminicola]|uniref:aldehyde dehydrogenase family protein n=1 Tax=Demequina sediminicola TaxID=1095026 RepID=UPI0007817F20|nr:aldehyde dehydrogenase family protein [Demequina sediminicola]